jgi:hypothetical protein
VKISLSRAARNAGTALPLLRAKRVETVALLLVFFLVLSRRMPGQNF